MDNGILGFIDDEFPFKTELLGILERLMKRQDEWFVGMKNGTKHDIDHLNRVAANVLDLIGTKNFTEYSPVKKAVYAFCIIVHDNMLRLGRSKHADKETIYIDILERFSSIETNRWFRKSDIDALADIAAAHSGKNTLQALVQSSKYEKGMRLIWGERISMPEIASVLRLADEFEEGPHRVNYSVLEKCKEIADEAGKDIGYPLYSREYAYHKLSEMITFNDLDAEEIECRVTASYSDMVCAIYGDPTSNPPREMEFMHNFVFARCLKSANELSYCVSFLPQDVAARRVRIKLCDDRGICEAETVLVDPEDDIWQLYRSNEMQSRFLVPQANVLFNPAGPEDALAILKSTIGESFAGLFGRCLKSAIVFGSIARGDYCSDIDICLIIDCSVDGTMPPKELLITVIREWEDRYNRRISVEQINSDQAFSRFAVGDPLMCAIANEGACLLDSEYHHNLKVFASQSLIFPIIRLRCVLDEFLRIDYEAVKALAAMEQAIDFIKASYRCICLCRQLLRLAKNSTSVVTIEECVALSRVAQCEFQDYEPQQEHIQSGTWDIIKMFKNRSAEYLDYKDVTDVVDVWRTSLPDMSLSRMAMEGN